MRIRTTTCNKWLGVAERSVGDSLHFAGHGFLKLVTGICLSEHTNLSDDEHPNTETDSSESPFMHIIVRRSEVEGCAIEPTLKALQVLTSDKETATRFQNHVTLSFQGYDDDARRLFQIEEVCAFVRKLNERWYSWFFFMTKDVHISPLAVIVLCSSGHRRTTSGLFVPRVEDSKDFFWNHFGFLRGLCQSYNLSEKQTESAVQEVIEYSMKVGFVEGCDLPQLAADSAKTGTIIRYMIAAEQ